MPTYQYRCTECGHDLEAVQKFTDAALTECPNCGGSLRKVFNAVGVVFKGSGFYRNDSRSSTSGDGKGDGASSKESGDGSGSSGSSASKDSGSSASSGGKDAGTTSGGSGTSSAPKEKAAAPSTS